MALDSAALRGLALVVDSALNPKPEDIPRLRAAAEPYLDPELQRDPRRFFAFLDEPSPRPQMRVTGRRTLDGGTVVTRKFTSNYRPFIATADASCPENETVHVEHWRHAPTPARATILALHGFTMGQPWIDAFLLLAGQWFANGLDVALVTLPFHGARAPRVAGFSGELFASPDPGRLNEAVRQAVHDVRLVSTWLRATTKRPVGLLGLSLGGYVAALMAGLSDEPDFVIPLVAPVCLGDLAWRFFTQSRHYHPEVAPLFTRDELVAAYRIHSPLTHPRRVARERLLIVAGRGDRVVPPGHPHVLSQHWDEAAIHWFSGSHLAPFRRPRIVARVVAHLCSLGIL
jgi:pimeloyl-ACP methyl ester carboxylesterase